MVWVFCSEYWNMQKAGHGGVSSRDFELSFSIDKDFESDVLTFLLAANIRWWKASWKLLENLWKSIATRSVVEGGSSISASCKEIPGDSWNMLEFPTTTWWRLHVWLKFFAAGAIMMRNFTSTGGNLSIRNATARSGGIELFQTCQVQTDSNRPLQFVLPFLP